jgi:DNA-binding transcriptional MocR family regulator
VVSWTEPVGGYLVWVRFLGGTGNGDRFARCCRRNRVVVSPGRDFFPGASPQTCFRISISMLDEPAIVEGVTRLGRAVLEMASGGELS